MKVFTWVLLGLAPLDLLAATHTWTGAVSNQWSVAGNWMEGTTPVGDASAALVFPASGTNAPSNDLSSLTIESITFTGSPNNVSLSGLAITLNGGLTVDANVASGFPSIDFNVQLGAAQTFTVANPTVALSIAGDITGASNATLAFAGNGSFYVYDKGAYGGGTVVGVGTHVYVSTAQSLGDASMGTLVQGTGGSGGILGFYPSASTCAESLVLQDGAYFVGLNGVPFSATYAGAVTLLGNVHMDVYGGETWTMSGLISGSGGIAGGTSDGTLVLAGANTYTGPTTVQGQNLANTFKLRVNGNQPSSAVTVNNAGVLGGTGTVGALVVNSGGKVGPGASPGILSVSGDATFTSGSTFSVELNGPAVMTGYDRLSVNGNATLGNATLEVLVGYTPTIGTMFTILQTTGSVSGTFAGLANGDTLCAGGQNFQITYSANAVTLTAMGPDSTSPVVTAPSATTVTQTLCM